MYSINIIYSINFNIIDVVNNNIHVVIFNSNKLVIIIIKSFTVESFVVVPMTIEFRNFS